MTQIQDEGVGKTVAVSPILVENTKIAICDDDGNEQQTDLAELRSSEGILDPNQASLNIDNSTDVIVGPVTQFMGPVTIFQNVNGQINPPNRLDQNPTIPRIQTPPPTTTPQQYAESKFSSTDNVVRKMALKYVIYAVVGAAIAVGLTLAIVFSTRSPKLDPPTPKPDPDDESGIDYNKKWLLSTKDWHAKPRLNFTRPLHPPVDYVIISHTVTPMCYTYRDCSQRIRNIQSNHMNGGKSPDIGYNFLVGADGHAYEGRGWHIRNFHTDKSIGICLIGDFTTQEPTKDMMESTQRLLEQGIFLNILSTKYVLLAHNQTYPTESPGGNVYKIISKWPHFDPEVRLN